jgi:hypothetical protein
MMIATVVKFEPNFATITITGEWLNVVEGNAAIYLLCLRQAVTATIDTVIAYVVLPATE